MHGWYNESYTGFVKTAISIPDDIFEAAELMAARRKMSRSELYARAVADWLDRHRDDRVTEALDSIYGADESTASVDSVVQSLQVRSIRRRRR